MSTAKGYAQVVFGDIVGAGTRASINKAITCTAFQDRDLTMVGAGTEVVVMGAVTTAKHVIIHVVSGSLEIRTNAEAAGHTVSAGGVYALSGCSVTAISLVYAADAHAKVYMAGV